MIIVWGKKGKFCSNMLMEGLKLCPSLLVPEIAFCSHNEEFCSVAILVKAFHKVQLVRANPMSQNDGREQQYEQV